MIRYMGAPIATPRVRALSAALKQIRTDKGVGQRELARMLGIQHANISFWESGKRIPDVTDVAAILAKLDVTGPERERILDLARHATEPNWLTAGVPGMSPGLAGVLDCERTASTITDWSPLVLPGLLHTSDYARALLSAGLPANEAEPRVMMRMARRDVLIRSQPANMIALIHERALDEVMGSPTVQVDQLRHVLTMAERPNVTIQVVQSGQGWHPGMAGPFILFDFPGSPSIVHIEHHRSSAFLYDEADVQDYKAAAEAIRSVAMSPEESLELIAGTITKLESAL
jgi:DNA-binding XRE family transcriptional regulator